MALTVTTAGGKVPAMGDACLAVPKGEALCFRRGDSNADGSHDITDPIYSLAYMYLGEKGFCADAMDANDDGILDITDPIYDLEFQYLAGPPPPSPGLTSCGIDPTGDSLGCGEYDSPAN